MPDYKVVLLRRGDSLQHETFIGGQGEVTVNTDTWQAVVHDGITPGGYPLKVEATTYDRPRYLTFRAALTQQGIASLGFSAPENAPVPIPIIENGVITGAAVFSYQASQSVQDHFLLPEDWVPPIDLQVLWRTDILIGTVSWEIETLGVPAGEAITDAVFNTPQYVSDEPAQESLALTTSVLYNLDTTNLVAGSECFFNFSRSAADSLEADAQLIALQFIIRVRGK